jgi:hypothetical protein
MRATEHGWSSEAVTLEICEQRSSDPHLLRVKVT